MIVRSHKRKALLLILAVFAIQSIVSVGNAAPSPISVGEDPEGDWNSDPNLAMVGSGIGQDLTGGAVAMPDTDTVEFIISVAELPPADSTVTGVYGWGFRAGKEQRTLVSCGHPVEECESRSNFKVFGECTDSTTNVGPLEIPETSCEVLGEVPATYDIASATITIPVTLETLGAAPGSRLRMTGGGIIASTYVVAIVDQYRSGWDTLETYKTLKIPF